MGLRVLLAEIVCVVRAYHGQPRLLVNAQHSLVDCLLILDAMVLELQVEPLWPKDLGQFQRILLGVFIFSVPQPPWNLPCEARREGDQPCAVFSQQLQINPGADIEPLRPSR